MAGCPGNFKNSHDIFTTPLNERFDTALASGILHTEGGFSQADNSDKVICRTSCFAAESMHDFGKKTGFRTSCYHNALGVGLKPCILLRTMKASVTDGASVENDRIFSLTKTDISWFNSMVVPVGSVDFKYEKIKEAADVANCAGGTAKKKTIRVMAGPFSPAVPPGGHGLELVPDDTHGQVPKMKHIDISVIATKKPKYLKSGVKHLAWNIFDINKNRDATVGKTVDAVPPDNNENYFIIVDQDLGLLKDLKNNVAQLPAGRTITLNMMHSVLTYSDSAPAKCVSTTSRIDQAGFRQPALGGQMYNAFDWEVNHTSLKEISKNNPVFLSEYSVDITQGLPSVSCTQLKQIWRHEDRKPAGKFPQFAIVGNGNIGTAAAGAAHTSTKLKVFNPNERNQKGTAAGEVNGATTLEEANFALQRKRSGDHLQIWFAYCFPKIAAESAHLLSQPGGLTASPYIFPKNPKTPPVGWVTPTFKMPPAGMTKVQMETWYKERTFFCTHDVPAATYSIMCGVNTILNNSGYIASFNLVR